MFEMFSTREIVTVFYSLLLLLLVLRNEVIRQGIINLIAVACTKKLVIPFVLLVAYSAVLICLFSYVPLWRNIYIKDIAIWVIFVGVPISFNAVNKGAEKYYFRNILMDNLKITFIIDFFVNMFTFSVLGELIIQPIVVLFLLLQTVSETKEEYKNVRKLIHWILGIIGLIKLGFAIRVAYKSYDKVDVNNTIISFCIPILFSLLYTPVAYIFALWAKYETIFIRMSFKEPKDKKVIIKHRIAVLKACNFSLEKAYRFEKECIKNMHVFMKQKEFDKLIRNFKVKS